VEALYGSTGSGADDILEKMSFIHIDSNMVPYISPEEYESYHEQYVKSGRKTWSTTDAWKQRYTFSGKYGANLMEEVARYAVVAAQVARDLEGQFHVAGVHDVRETLVLVAVGVRDDESDVYAVARQSAGHSVAGRSQPACNVGRKLPSEH